MKNCISYRNAVKYCQNSYILANNIADLDPELFDDLEFYDVDDDREIYQYYISDCSRDDCEFLNRNFGVKFLYSPALELYILAVDHYGTSWDYVACDVLTADMRERINGSPLEYCE